MSEIITNNTAEVINVRQRVTELCLRTPNRRRHVYRGNFSSEQKKKKKKKKKKNRSKKLYRTFLIYNTLLWRIINFPVALRATGSTATSCIHCHRIHRSSIYSADLGNRISTRSPYAKLAFFLCSIFVPRLSRIAEYAEFLNVSVHRTSLRGSKLLRPGKNDRLGKGRRSIFFDPSTLVSIKRRFIMVHMSISNFYWISAHVKPSQMELSMEFLQFLSKWFTYIF